MTRTRMVALVLALPLVLAACGGGSGAKSDLLDQLRQEAADSGAPAELLDCLMESLEGLSESELQAILEDQASEETEQTVAQASADCMMQE